MQEQFENLKSLGIQDPDSIESYTLRQEAGHDILKIYFKKQKGEFFAKSVKFKYPRQRKTILVDSGTHEYKDITEINANLKYVVDELDIITQGAHATSANADIKQKILKDLRHLEKVVQNKIREIEQDLEKL
ncbi:MULTISPECIES: DUF3461 family protein [Aeromonas]|uniref:UPF0325 protein LA374_13245 n=2 Tax=Aeromonas TaxID=642 RepID=A0A0S2SIK7_9GAMM|nr:MULTISPECIES: DUF3461 family protein [Aeromonas]ALP41527.1 hypothetical protein WL1483_2108 [Aeromonas schubertii]ENY72513.1 hypothetical protein G114_07550 [Aeromonas diversa CDC 2478-85]KUE80749.1 hypothetical protein ATO46_15190 [Aeromonas schubertii]MBZ6067163.1 DUF3461 family protein [Aeromonas schubertii]MBZ6074229.1 DUF3461 family protein [Aeromonas schubertii]